MSAIVAPEHARIVTENTIEVRGVWWEDELHPQMWRLHDHTKDPPRSRIVRPDFERFGSQEPPEKRNSETSPHARRCGRSAMHQVRESTMSGKERARFS